MDVLGASTAQDDITWWEVSVNQPPNIPITTFPADASTEIPRHTNLSWSGSDPEGDALSYNIYIGTNNPPTTLIANSISDTTLPVILDYASTYYWRVTVTDSYGDSTQGSIWSFITKANDPPDEPVVIAPGNTEIDIIRHTNLRWSGSDPDGDSLFYDVYLDQSNPPTTQLADSLIDTTLSVTLDYVTTYFWRVIAIDTNGDTTQGAVWSFTTKTNEQPNIPHHNYPADGAHGVCGSQI